MWKYESIYIWKYIKKCFFCEIYFKNAIEVQIKKIVFFLKREECKE